MFKRAFLLHSLVRRSSKVERLLAPCPGSTPDLYWRDGHGCLYIEDLIYVKLS